MEIHNYTFLNLSNNNLLNNQKCNFDVPQTPLPLTFDQQEQDMMTYQQQQPKKYFRMNSLEYLSIISELPNNLLSDSMTNLFNNMTKATPTPAPATTPACAHVKTGPAPTNSQEDPLEVPQITPFSFSFTNLQNANNAANNSNNNFLFVNNNTTSSNNAFVPIESIPAFNAAAIIANSLNFAHLAGANIPFVNNISNNNNCNSAAVPPPPADDFNVDTFLNGVDAAVKPEPPASRPKMEK